MLTDILRGSIWSIIEPNNIHQHPGREPVPWWGAYILHQQFSIQFGTNEKHIFLGMDSKPFAAKQKAVIREVGILREDESVSNLPVTSYKVYI